MDMSFVYSIVQGEKAMLDNFKKIVEIVSIPIAIKAYPWLKALQESISLISYLCTADDVMKLTDKLFDFRGPVVISEVHDEVYINQRLDLYNNIIPVPVKDSSYDSNSGDSALRDFLELKTVVAGHIKNIKEPTIEIK
ncbi:hypothetical protein PG637_01750 [Riemerella anatipestifer]|nr:hypothetical protein [Riemerella anatipestifer]MDY3324394.1 hypothetical protein [Riemerella anatipestifer]MDY3353209.1 hypothetical protein [Riemerella anatipestifer]